MSAGLREEGLKGWPRQMNRMTGARGILCQTVWRSDQLILGSHQTQPDHYYHGQVVSQSELCRMAAKMLEALLFPEKR